MTEMGQDLPPHMQNLETALAQFNTEVATILMGRARAKGYSAGSDDGRALLDFVSKHAHGHAEGEIMYKITRWCAKREPEDLLKIAAWAFLIWDQQRRMNP